jgi:hypothetical protein
VNAVDRHRPAVSGDVPVQFIESGSCAAHLEEAKCISNPVADDDLPVGVIRTGNPDAERARPAIVLAGLFYPESLATRVSDVADRDVELGRAPLRGVVMEREVADDSVPLPCESDCQLLGDIERSIGMNGQKRIEVADADGPALRARGARKRENEEEGEGERPTNR